MSLKSAKAKGSSLELRIAKLFRGLGFSDCMTSRLGSTYMDNLKVDLINCDPFYLQCKAVENLGSPHKILLSMPKHKGKINVVAHKKNHQGTVYSMSEENFFHLVKLLKDNNLI